jgi:hypothetical protein
MGWVWVADRPGKIEPTSAQGKVAANATAWFAIGYIHGSAAALPLLSGAPASSPPVTAKGESCALVSC